MAVYSETLQMRTNEGSIVDITDGVERVVRNSRMRNGLACVFVSGSTGAVTTVEYESGLLSDLSRTVERLFPKGMEYKHNARWGDGNGHSHVRASFIGPSLTVPFSNGNLNLGTWQQIIFLELDIRARTRELIVQLVGE